MMREASKRLFLIGVCLFTIHVQIQAQTTKAKSAPSKLGNWANSPLLSSDTLLEQDISLIALDSITKAKKVASSNSSGFSFGKTIGQALETFMPLQFKYAIMLNESVEKLTNLLLYKNIDTWYGTRYRYGGKSAAGIDCSAFMQVLAKYTFGWALPRTAREQYKSMAGVSRNELKEGDFVFFNTTGGISHVGMYLQNNKFIHSSSSQGVSIGDLNSSYWSRRFIGARRMIGSTLEASLNPASLNSILDRLR